MYNYYIKKLQTFLVERTGVVSLKDSSNILKAGSNSPSPSLSTLLRTPQLKLSVLSPYITPNILGIVK